MSFFQLGLTVDGVATPSVTEVGALLGAPGAPVWMDVPECTDEASRCSPTFRGAIRDGMRRGPHLVSGFIRITRS
jgi:hypothetical protein